MLNLLIWSYALFILYLAYVTLWAAKKSGKLATCPYAVQAVAWSVLGTMLAVDVAFNIVVGSCLFLELPELKRLTFTARCKKHMSADDFRGHIARWVCNGWLNPFEPGHC